MNDSQLPSEAVAKVNANTRGVEVPLALGTWFNFLRAGCVKPLAIVICSALSASGGENAAVDYIRDIRPILSNNCFKCHGPDEEARQGRSSPGYAGGSAR